MFDAQTNQPPGPPVGKLASRAAHMVMASIDEVLLVPIEVNTFCMWDTKPPWNADLQKSVLKSRLLAFPIVNAT